MKHILSLLVLAFLLSAHKCNEGSATTAAQVDGTKWMLESVNGKTIDLPEGVETPWVQLTGADNNRVKGFGGCNHLMGSFTMEGDRIGFPGLGSTKMYCEKSAGLEKSFMEALRTADSYKMQGDRLLLMAGSNEVAVLRAQ